MSFPAYPQYKDSGVAWLGSIPSHWEVSAIKRMAVLQSGESIVADQIGDAGEYPVYGGNGLRGYTSAYTHDGYFALVGRQGALCGNVNYASGRFWASEHAVVVSPVESVDTCWLGELLRTMNLNQYSTSAAQPGLSVETISKLKAVWPPYEEQMDIATFISSETARIDELITEQQRLMQLLKEKRQAVIAHAVTKGLNLDATTRESRVEWLGEVPAHWEIVRLGRIFRETMESGQETLPVLSVSIHHGVSDNELDEDELDRKVTRSEDRTKYKRVMRGDLVYNMMRAWQGGFGTVAVEGMVSPAYVVARPRQALITEYIEHLLRTPQAIEQMRRHSKGVTDFRLRLYWDEFKNIQVALPPVSEAKAICEQISRMDEEFDAVVRVSEASIALLQERRTALIHAAVTGKIDVRRLADAEAA